MCRHCEISIKLILNRTMPAKNTPLFLLSDMYSLRHYKRWAKQNFASFILIFRLEFFCLFVCLFFCLFVCLFVFVFVFVFVLFFVSFCFVLFFVCLFLSFFLCLFVSLFFLRITNVSLLRKT